MNTQALIRKLVSDFSGVIETGITPEQSLEHDLILDRLDIIEIAMACEEEFGVELLDDNLEKIKTVGDFYALVEQAL